VNRVLIFLKERRKPARFRDALEEKAAGALVGRRPPGRLANFRGLAGAAE
jgi:hypothetical protein